MITLAHAFKLFDLIKHPDVVYLRPLESHSVDAVGFCSASLVKYADLQRIKVYRVGTANTYDSSAHVEFEVNYNLEMLRQLTHTIDAKEYVRRRIARQ